MSDAPRAGPAVLVTGLPRSGTSMVAGALAECGLALGKTVPGTRENRSGFFENIQIRERVVKPLLTRMGCDPLGVSHLPALDAVPALPGFAATVGAALAADGIPDGRPWGYKDAKLTLVWPLWHHHFPAARWVIVERDPAAVVESCLRTGFMSSHSTDAAFWWRFVDAYRERLDALRAATGCATVDSDALVAGRLASLQAVVASTPGLTWRDERVRRFIEPRHWHRPRGEAPGSGHGVSGTPSAAGDFQTRVQAGDDLLEAGKPESALAAYRDALPLTPAKAAPIVHLKCGIARAQARDYDGAMESYGRALEGRPGFAEAFYNRGIARVAMGCEDAAVADYEQALACDPSLVAARTNLAVILRRRDELVHSLALAHENLSYAPEHVPSWTNLGVVRNALGDFDGAVTAYRRALELDPRAGEARYNLALVQLLRREWDAGWANYEHRFRLARFDVDPLAEEQPANPSAFRRGLPQPRWNGESLAGRTVVVWTEQGIGDIVMFARGLAVLADEAGRCVVETPRRFAPVLARSFPRIEQVPRTDPAQPSLSEPGVDFQIPIGSIPGVLHRRGGPGPFAQRGAYLVADPGRVASLRERYRRDGDRLVGIAWHTTNPNVGRYRNIALEDWLPILSVPGCRFVSLQYGDVRGSLARLAGSAGIEVLADDAIDALDSLDDFAAQVAAMDRVISIDNSTVHVAGALGVPTSVMLPALEREWRWGETGEDTPWYDSLRLFRRAPDARDWCAVVDAVAGALHAALGG